ncbi:DUF817 domain-containing protein [Pararhizobium antarcticum]|uniref:DUF817 domain-containing protein n=1 Tax=Pararhizobium antarcticum TaxID=1798805 RepID=A0A657LUT1_9HYPH|nr:DUF817 domain-containing protein [Pararhizobium antarcticum]OJF95088.1 hypothetical protein AX760_04495 [Pararhizobium antarcticum]OJF98090.1 hypothetical protein AX761_12795 [Rhizobium sp. 58]
MSEERTAHPTGPALEPLRLAIRRVLSRLPPGLSEFILFGLKQAWACLFGALVLFLIIATKLVWQPDWAINRYDALFVAALSIQVVFLYLKMESWDEAKVILIYHVVGTLMEIFKVHMGSWIYPEDALIRIAGVPLFSGFMYAAVGSYMARAIRIFDMRFTRYPPFPLTALLAIGIYLNFYTHHYIVDLRLGLFLATIVLFGRVRIYFTVEKKPRWMPLVLAALLTSVFLWIAENIGTATGIWLYPGQTDWHMVSLQKLGSWYLLLYVSFVLVTIVCKPQPPDMQEPPR